MNYFSGQTQTMHPKAMPSSSSSPSAEKVLTKLDIGIAIFQRNLQIILDHVKATIPDGHDHVLQFSNCLKKRLDQLEQYKILCVNFLLNNRRDEEALDIEERFHKCVKLYYSYRQKMLQRKKENPVSLAMACTPAPADAPPPVLSMPSLYEEQPVQTQTLVYFKEEVIDHEETVEDHNDFAMNLADIKQEAMGMEDDEVEEAILNINFTKATDEDLEEAVMNAAAEFELRHSYKYQIQPVGDHEYEYFRS